MDAWADKRAQNFTRSERRRIRDMASNALAELTAACLKAPDDIPDGLESLWREQLLERATAVLGPDRISRALARVRTRAEVGE